MKADKPTVLCFSGLDPTGGAGIQADIETLFSLGCHTAPIITVLTVQNTRDAMGLAITDPDFLLRQSRALLEDLDVQCFKLGLTGSVPLIEALHTVLREHPHVPVVLDPVTVAGGGYRFGGAEVVDALRTLLLPLTTVLTPNTDELKQLAPNAETPDAAVGELLDRGCRHVLLTGSHAATDKVINRLYSRNREMTALEWPRLKHVYHGSGCTLAAAIAAGLAHKLDVPDAVEQAQRFTWESLRHGRRPGSGQRIPDRACWNRRKP